MLPSQVRSAPAAPGFRPKTSKLWGKQHKKLLAAQCEQRNVMCAGRESNSGLVRGRDVYYHCTTGAEPCVSALVQDKSFGRSGVPIRRPGCAEGGQEAMAQRQRVGFQTRRLGVRIPLASFFFLHSDQTRNKKKKKTVAETGNRTQAAAATTRSPATRLFRLSIVRGGSGYRSRFSTLRRLYATMYNNPPKQMCVHRDSNPNLILGRDKYYPCTMDAQYLSTELCVRLRIVTFVIHSDTAA